MEAHRDPIRRDSAFPVTGAWLPGMPAGHRQFHTIAVLLSVLPDCERPMPLLPA